MDVRPCISLSRYRLHGEVLRGCIDRYLDDDIFVHLLLRVPDVSNIFLFFSLSLLYYSFLYIACKNNYFINLK